MTMYSASLTYASRRVYAGGILFAALLATLAGCNTGDPADSSSPSAAATNPAAPPPSAKKIDPKHPIVQIDTNQGSITIRLNAVQSPGTVRNFLNYASEGFYDNTIVHFVEPGKMIMAGGYSADRQPKQPRASIRNEAHNGLKNLRGTIAMARDQSMIDGATSQFFINLADAPQRDYHGDAAALYGYCVFGEVTEGLNVAERISQSPTTNNGGDLVQTPDPPVVIKSIRLIQ